MNYLKVFLLVFFFVLILDLYKIKGKSYSHPERLVLEKLYSMTNGINWVRQDNWLSNSISICDWYGVICDENNHAVEIHLDNNGLKGSLPDELSNLTELKVLYLSNNEIEGGVPQTITQCKNLESIWVKTKKAPETKVNCSYLKWFDFGC